MGISRLESIIRNYTINNTINNINSNTPNITVNSGISKMSLADLPAIANTRANPNIKMVVIDTSEFIYKSIIGGDHTSGLLNFLEKMFRNQLFPIFVFDGKPPKEKNRIIEERKRIKDRARDKVTSIKDKLEQADQILSYVSTCGDNFKNVNNNSYDSNSSNDLKLDSTNFTESAPNINLICDPSKIKIDTLKELFSDGSDTSDESICDQDILDLPCDDLIEKLRCKISDLISESERVGKKMVGIQDKQYADIKKLFNLFNIPYIQAGVEAEMICTALVKLGIADYCIGNDMDLFALGCPRIIRNINFRDDIVDVYYFNDILTNLGLTYNEFVDFCILLGSDYTSRMGGVKNYHILKFIQKYRSIENILSNIDEINAGLIGEFTEDGTQRTVRIAEQFDYMDARAIFHTEFVFDQIASLFPYSINDMYKLCSVRCLELRNNLFEVENIMNFCREKCNRLNNMLIIKKINTIIWSNIFNDTASSDDFIIVRPKKTSPININRFKSNNINYAGTSISINNNNRNEIIRDIKARGQQNLSRIAFGSSPNHALVMDYS